MSRELCKGGCGNIATINGWCKIKWKSGNKYGVNCPKIEEKRGKSISLMRLNESKQKRNPMQNPEICKKNHSFERNKKCSEILKERGKLGLLPQQTESLELKDKRRKNVSQALKKLFEDGKHPRQLESQEERRERVDKITKKLVLLGKEGKLPVQNMTQNQKLEFGKKISEKLREGIKSGRIKLSPSWKKVPYKNINLRSYWEKIVAEFLDKNKIEWKYETLKIPYFDTQRKVEATTIPDFYIPSRNLVIEVKSNAEFNSQKTKDKTESIKKKGYNFILIGRKQIELIKNNKLELAGEIK